ncbi:MAG: major capsid protein [Spirochaetes bacterium]|nr:major capsid protein [Spirochaetota bacterium]
MAAKKTMLAAFKQKKAPTMFLSSWFKTTDRDIFRSRKAVIDIKRQKEQIAVDVVRGTGGLLVSNKRFTTKEYTPPLYDLYNSYFEEELNERLPGGTEYDNPDYLAQIIATITDDQVEVQEMIMRAIEWQAANIFVTGTVPLINGDTIDYKMKATHSLPVGTVWSNTSAAPITNIKDACQLNRKDGLVESTVAIFGDTAWANFLARIKADGSLNILNAELGKITMPVANANGAVFHGEFVAGSFRLQAWTYPQYYDVPTGYGLSNEGTKQPYIPTDKVLILPMSNAIDLRLIYAGIPELVNRKDAQLQALGIDRYPANVRGDFLPYAFTDDERTCLKVGVRSAPLCVPTQIDGWCVINTNTAS